MGASEMSRPVTEKRPYGRLLVAWAFLTALGALCVVGDGSIAGSLLSMRGLASSPVTIKIGTTLPLSGKDAAIGRPMENGIRLAIDQANAAHFLPGYAFALAAR